MVEKSKRLPVLADALKQTEAQRSGAAAAKELAGGKRRAQRARVVELANVDPSQLRDTQVQEASMPQPQPCPGVRTKLLGHWHKHCSLLAMNPSACLEGRTGHTRKQGQNPICS